MRIYIFFLNHSVYLFVVVVVVVAVAETIVSFTTCDSDGLLILIQGSRLALGVLSMHSDFALTSVVHIWTTDLLGLLVLGLCHDPFLIVATKPSSH